MPSLTSTPAQVNTKKPARHVSLQPDGRVRIVNGRIDTLYVVVEIRCDIGGRGFEVSNTFNMEVYHTHLNGRDRSCDCIGHLRHGHCKHADALAALIAAGKLPAEKEVAHV
jgi:hypothetical protein